MKKYDVVALGELLIDFTENGTSGQGNPILEANPGGAPCNVLAMLSKLNKTTAFIGKVGEDMFGNQLEQAIREVGIATGGLLRDDTVPTTLAFVKTAPDGDREFSFYRNPGADMMLTKEDVAGCREMIEEARIFHYGSLSMTAPSCMEATQYALQLAKDAGAVLSFDPNLRPPLWSSLEKAKECILYGMSQCNILKISDNEIQWLTGETDYDAAVRWIQQKYEISLILVSLGKEGSMAYCGEEKVFVPAFVQDKTIETTGAGDTFCGCILYHILEYGYRSYTRQELVTMLRFANAAASIVTTRKGALRVMPDLSAITSLLSI